MGMSGFVLHVALISGTVAFCGLIICLCSRCCLFSPGPETGVCEDPQDTGSGLNNQLKPSVVEQAKQVRGSEPLIAMITTALWLFICSVILLVAIWITHIWLARSLGG